MKDFSSQLDCIMGAGGSLSSLIPGFVFRQEQYDLAKTVADALSDDDFLLAEAGTGVGKSFAYLVPAILWAINYKEKVVIATKTKALQNQLVSKDIPALQEHLGINFECVEVKGRENYLCWHKYHQIKAGRISLNHDQQFMIEKVLKWAENTRTGDRMELGLGGALLKNWFLLAADRQSCQKERCRFQERCFRMKMIRRAKNADVIITNHSMLLADLAAGSQILPDFQYVIIDEAHVFPQEVFEQSSARFALDDISIIMHFLYSKEKQKERGYLIPIKQEFSELAALVEESCGIISRAHKLLRKLFKTAGDGIVNQSSAATVFLNGAVDGDWLSAMVEIHDECYHALMLAALKLRDIAAGDPSLGDMEDYAIQFELWAQNSRDLLNSWIYQDERICWLDCQNGKVLAFCSANLDQADVVDNILYRKMTAVIMISATLTVEDDFSSMVERAALLPYKRAGRLREFVAGSPFDYDQNAKLFIVDDLPDPGHPSFDIRVAELIGQIINPALGKTMLLFTSRRSMTVVTGLLRSIFQESGVELLVQYEDGDFAAIMDKFTQLDHAVLAGLETYWEGVDLKGDLLKLLVIVKIPFRSPSDPYFAAWERYYRSTGQNAFAGFMLPDAALRFKQGAGRLIRSESDHGALVVLDKRLIDKPYGKTILKSLPIKNQQTIARSLVADHLAKWL